MRNTLLYLVILVALGAGVWYFLFREEEVFSSTEAGFTLKDTGSIRRIYLADKQSNVNLTRTPQGWRVNDIFDVLPASLATLMQGLYGQYAIAPVPREAHNNVVKALAANSIKVEIYGGGGQKIRSFFVGNEAVNMNNTYMLMEGASRPYIVTLRGFEGILTPRYSPYLYDWRDRTVFRIEPKDIRRVSVNYPEGRGSFSIANPPDAAPKLQPAMAGLTPETNRLTDYLGFFKNLNAESFVNGTIGLDSIIRHTDPLATILVETTTGPQQAELYWMEKTQRSGTASAEVNGRIYDVERFYAVRNRKDTMVVQKLSFQKVLQYPEVFYPGNDAPDSL